MNLNEINFSFAGKHCLRDFGCTYVESGGHAISAQVQRNLYPLGGMSGTVELGAPRYEMPAFAGELFFEQSPPSQAAAQKALRRIMAWLTQGRQRLIFDYEPDVFYLATVSAPGQWAFDSWIDGGLKIQFDPQPFAYNLRESVARKTTQGTAETLRLVCDTGQPAPLKVRVENTGTAAITGLTVACGRRQLVFASLGLTAGKELNIDMEPPAGARIGEADALPLSTQFDYMEVGRGPTDITIALAYGAGDGRGAALQVSARGRY